MQAFEEKRRRETHFSHDFLLEFLFFSSLCIKIFFISIPFSNFFSFPINVESRVQYE